MKLKKVLLLALTSVVLSGCDFFEVGIFPSINDGSSSEVNQNTSSGNNGGNSENSQHYSIFILPQSHQHQKWIQKKSIFFKMGEKKFDLFGKKLSRDKFEP